MKDSGRKKARGDRLVVSAGFKQEDNVCSCGLTGTRGKSPTMFIIGRHTQDDNKIDDMIYRIRRHLRAKIIVACFDTLTRFLWPLAVGSFKRKSYHE
jgi:hypothetical protein